MVAEGKFSFAIKTEFDIKGDFGKFTYERST